jgi:tetratricopeptide (TPR) repeat protein
VWQKVGETHAADELLQATRTLDPLDIFSRFLATGTPPDDGQRRLDLAFDLVHVGLLQEALKALEYPLAGTNNGATALLLYLHADTLERLQQHEASSEVYRRAEAASADYVFPGRLDELQMLQRAIARNPTDARAPYYLGNLLYDRRRYDEAIALWERSNELDGGLPTVWRNLGFAYFNVRHDADAALAAFLRARALAPNDARILYEQDQLRKRTGEGPEQRLTTLQTEAALVARRDDLSVELATLYNSTDQPQRALDVLLSRQFGPWEGGEGLVLGQYVRANVLLARKALQEGNAAYALERLQAASAPPANLSEAMHLLANRSMVDYWLGKAHAAADDAAAAATSWERAAGQRGDFQQMQVQAISEMTYWSALALKELGRNDEAAVLFERIGAYGREFERQEPKIDYFATSLPTMLLFEEDAVLRHKVAGRLLQAQAMLGLGQREEASTLLKDVLRLDRNYAPALDLTAESAG